MLLPLWSSPDLLPLVCHHVDTVQHLASLSQVSKHFNAYLFSITGGKHWVHAGKLVCGEEYWPANPLENTDPRYLTMMYMCPWVSEPQKVIIPNKERMKKFRYPFTDEERTNLERLRGWAPETMPHYSETRRAIKVHNGALVVVQQHSGVNEAIEGHVYFVASKDLRLLRDMFYFSHETVTARWIITPGRILCGSPYRSHGWMFGFRDDKTIHLLSDDECARTVQAFWAAFKGDMQTALQQLDGMYLKDLSVHCMDLCHHTVQSGSIDALRMLLDAEPAAGDHYNFVHTLEIGRPDMAQLILSKSMLAAEQSGNLIEKYKCIGWHRISNWIEYGDHKIPRDLKDMLALYRRSHTIVADGKSLPDIIDELMNEARLKMARVMRALRPAGGWKI